MSNPVMQARRRWEKVWSQRVRMSLRDGAAHPWSWDRFTDSEGLSSSSSRNCSSPKQPLHPFGKSLLVRDSKCPPSCSYILSRSLGMNWMAWILLAEVILSKLFPSLQQIQHHGGKCIEIGCGSLKSLMYMSMLSLPGGYHSHIISFFSSPQFPQTTSTPLISLIPEALLFWI